MEVQIDSTLLELVEKLGVDKIKAINEGLTLWLKEKLTTCPITNKFCTNNKNPCNECNTFTKKHC